jgi:hypothetical protein
MMNHLKVPGPLSGFSMEGKQAGGKQIITGAEPTEKIYGRTVGWDKDQSEFLVS